MVSSKGNGMMMMMLELTYIWTIFEYMNYRDFIYPLNKLSIFHTEVIQRTNNPLKMALFYCLLLLVMPQLDL